MRGILWHLLSLIGKKKYFMLFSKSRFSKGLKLYGTVSHTWTALYLNKNLLAVVCANVCTIKIFSGSKLSFMRVYIYCWDDSVREYSWNIFLYENFMCRYSNLKFHKVIKIENFVVNYNMVFNVLYCEQKKILCIHLFCFVQSLLNLAL